MTTKSAPAPGCLVSSKWGQFKVPRMIQIAKEMGFDDISLIYLAEKALTRTRLSNREFESLMDADQVVVDWLNEFVAADGYSFGWNEEEFYYMSNIWWGDE